MRLVTNYPNFTELYDLIYKYPEAKRLNLFLDLKNSIRPLYEENVVKNLLENYSSREDAKNLMLFSSWLDFVSNMYKFSYESGLSVCTYTVADMGEYQYHKSIFQDYKANRALTKSKTSPYLSSDAFHKFLMENYEAILSASQAMSNAYMVYLKYCESDFVSYYVIKNFYDRDDCINLICSTDRDMFQTFIFKNTEQYFRHHGPQGIFYNKDNWHEAFHYMRELPIDRYIYMRSMMGDSSDGISGIPKIGAGRASEIMNLFTETPASYQEFEDTINDFAHEDDPKYRIAQAVALDLDTVHRNYKLMSFEELMKNLSVTVTEIIENIHTKDNERWDIEATIDFINMTQKKIVEITSQ